MEKEFAKISSVSHSYGQIDALKDIDLTVWQNELFGVIGPDGSGKTTLFRILATLLIPDEGTVTYEGADIVDNFISIRQIIGYMPGRFSLYQDLSVEENLGFFASVFKSDVKENYYLIEDIYKQLEPFKKRRAGNLSGGMKQKLALSCALIHKPKLLLLDEPTTGVDAVSRREFWDMLSRLKEMGITIVVSTPYMDEATRCDRIALIKSGVIMRTDKPDNVVKQFGYNVYALRHDKNFQMLKKLKENNEIVNAYAYGQDVHVVADKGRDIGKVVSSLASIGFNGVKSNAIVPTIEDCFIQYMIENKEVDATS